GVQAAEVDRARSGPSALSSDHVGIRLCVHPRWRSPEKLRLLPRTLLARLMLLIALLLTIGQFAALKLFDYFEREPRATAAAMQAITVVNFTRASLIAAHENRRLALLSELTGREGVRIYALDMLEEVEPLPEDP